MAIGLVQTQDRHERAVDQLDLRAHTSGCELLSDARANAFKIVSDPVSRIETRVLQTER